MPSPQPISAETLATTFTGSEIIPLVQSGSNKRATLSSIWTSLGKSPAVTVGYTNADIIIPAGASITSYLNAAINAAVAGTTNKWIHVKAGNYSVGASIVLRTGITLTGDGESGTVFTAANGLNSDIFISEHFYTQTNVDFQGYIDPNYVRIADFAVNGNSGNQTASGQTNPSLMHKSIGLYGYKLSAQRIFINDSKEVGFYSEFSNHQPTVFEDYSSLPSIFEDIDVKGYGQYGIVNRGPHDSYWNRCFAATSQYETPVAGIFVDQGANYSIAGTHMDNCYANGNDSFANLWIQGFPSLTGSFYGEGSKTGSAIDIQVSSCQLRLFAGYSANGITYRGDSGGSFSRAEITTWLYYTEPPVAYKLLGNIQNVTFIHGGGNPSNISFAGTLNLYDTTSYTGGNNIFTGRTVATNLFSDDTKLNNNDRVDMQNDSATEANRKSYMRIPQGASYMNITDVETTTAKPLGYRLTAGGTATQATSKATGVTLSKPTGSITLNAAALAANTIVSFTLTNTLIGASDVLILNHISGGTGGAYALNAQCAAGSASINVTNLTAGSLSEAIVIKYSLLKGVSA